MSQWFDFIRHHKEVYCPECRQRIARRASDSPVLSRTGQPMRSDSFGGVEDTRADYEVRCPHCKNTFEVQTPEDAEQMHRPSLENATAPPVVRLT